MANNNWPQTTEALEEEIVRACEAAGDCRLLAATAYTVRERREWTVDAMLSMQRALSLTAELERITGGIR